jgi:Fe-S oxidoreductase
MIFNKLQQELEGDLFPDDDEIIVAPGTSCRHHIFDATGRKVLHPVEVLYEALI